MLYSLSGTQGSGKSTIISDLSNLGYNTIERKTSRSVLKDWNMDLSWIYSDSDLMKDFQDEILKRKYLDEQSAIESSEIWFTDRSYVDLLVYSCIILGHNSQNKDWLDFDEFRNTIKPDTTEIKKLATQFLGRPYLWGGTSARAMDCSGFIKTLYFMNGLLLARDASLQTKYGTLVNTEANFNELKTGDLLFFGVGKASTAISL